MNISFRVDASIKIGSGHVMRCLSLAKALRRLQHNIEFVCLDLDGNLIDRIKDAQFDVRTIEVTRKLNNGEHQQDYSSWLPHSQQDDAERFVDAVENVDLVIVDHYAIDILWETLVKTELNCPLMAIDDLIRTHSSDIVLDQTLNREINEYSSIKTVLCGQNYALLDPKYAVARERTLERSTPSTPVKLLVSFGAVDATNATLDVLKSLASYDNIVVTIVLSRTAPNVKSIESICRVTSNFNHIDYTNNMEELMLNHDVAIGAPGTTSWERACLGLPSIIIPIADNQLMMCKQLSRNKVAIHIDQTDIEKCLHNELSHLLERWDAYHKSNLSLCDGLGVFRVAQAVDNICIGANYYLLPVSMSDAKQLHEWQKASETRQYALNKSIPSWNEHVNWLTAKLDSSTNFFYKIVDSQQQALGAIRLDRSSELTYIISIYIAPNLHGKGIGSTALKLIDQLHPHIQINATVLRDNLASRNLFKKANYIQRDDQLFVRPPLN